MKVRDKKAVERYEQKLALIKSGAAANPFESKDEQAARKEKAKRDPAYFVEYYMPHYATSKSAKFHLRIAVFIISHPILFLLLRWGRALAKSVWVDVIIPLWLWINDDIHYMVIIGNNYDKAKILLSDLQAEFEANERLKHDWGTQEMRGNWEDGYFRTKNGFIAKALGMGQSPRGLRFQARRPDYIVCDDLEDRETIKNPMRQDEIVRWIEKDLIPTMDGPARRFINANNNSHPRTIQEELHVRHPGWTLDQVDAYDPITYEPAWPEKYSSDYYRKLEEDMGILATQAEYLNKPHIEGKIFTEDQIQWGKIPALNHFKTIAGHWDIAYAGNKDSDFNAIRVWGVKETDFWYIDSYVRQSKMVKALEWMVMFQRSLPPTVSVLWRFESQFWNDEVRRTIAEVEAKHNINLALVKVDTPKTKKYDRILTLQPYYQNGRIYYNDAKFSHNDTATGLQQLYGIEPGYRTHDDAPDADQQCIEWLSKHTRRGDFKSRTGRLKKNQKRRL
jgi:phage terminase large subunit-like protein